MGLLDALISSKQVLAIKTTLGENKFLVLNVEGDESLGRLPEFNVEMVADPEDVSDLRSLLGTVATITLDVKDDPRYFNLHITKLERTGEHGQFEMFKAQLHPWLWQATLSFNSKVFNEPNKTVKDIVTTVLQPYSTNLTWKLAAQLKPIDFCVQYQESDFDFVSRLLEEHGIYYFFEHTDSKHTMVLIDSLSKHETKPSSDPIHWANTLDTDAVIIDWHESEEARSVKAVVRDYDYLATATTLQAIQTPPKPQTKLGTAEVFAYPANIVQNSAGPEANPSTDPLMARAKVLMESLVSMRASCSGITNVRDVSAGTVFTLDNHTRSDANDDYLVVSARYRMEFGQHEAVEGLKDLKRGKSGFLAALVVIKSNGDPFRPKRVTKKPRVHGPQTAVVVGASGNEIETDKHGRVKILFPWDRLGKKDQTASCWVRVATPWASKNYGMISLPRIGDEVVVSFIGGDPDKPLITGSVYNDVNPPIYELPANATMSGIKTRTSKEGKPENANELRFEDKKDGEYIWLQAEKNFYRHVKKDSFEFVGQNETLKTVKDRKDVVGDNWSLDVGKDVMQNFGKDLHVTVAGDIFYKGGATWQVKLEKDLSLEMGGDFGYAVKGKTGFKSTGDVALTTGGEAHIKGGPKVVIEGTKIELKASGGLVLDCSGGITLKCGGSLVALTSGGVDIVGSMVKINSGGGGPSAGSAKDASPSAPTEAKKLADIEPGKKADYDKNFDDPLKKTG